MWLPHVGLATCSIPYSRWFSDTEQASKKWTSVGRVHILWVTAYGTAKIVHLSLLNPAGLLSLLSAIKEVNVAVSSACEQCVINRQKQGPWVMIYMLCAICRLRKFPDCAEHIYEGLNQQVCWWTRRLNYYTTHTHTHTHTHVRINTHTRVEIFRWIQPFKNWLLNLSTQYKWKDHSENLLFRKFPATQHTTPCTFTSSE